MNKSDKGSVVKYIEEYFLYIGMNKSDKCRLVSADGSIFSGTPEIDKLEHIKQLEVYKHDNNHSYVSTIQGYFSLSTGKNVTTAFIEKGIII